MENIYMYLTSSIMLFLGSMVLLKKILYKDYMKPSRNVKKIMAELEERLKEDPDDYSAIYEMALCEEEIGRYDDALEKFEQLANAKVLDRLSKKEELEVYQKLESKYSKDPENSLKYAIKILKIDPNNNLYNIKVATTLAREGSFKHASIYFNKAIVAKSSFSIEELKYAIFTFFKLNDYKKSITFLEEMHKRCSKDSKFKNELEYIEPALYSMYLMSDENNVAKIFLENALNKSGMDKSHKLLLNRMYLFVLYKLEETTKFENLYNRLESIYALDNRRNSIASLILDYAFYSYFLKNLKLSESYFKSVLSFNVPEFSSFNIDGILGYLSEISKATNKLYKLKMNNPNDKKYKSDNFRNYINKDYITIWENAVKLWEASFIDLRYLNTLVEIKNTINIENVLKDINLSTKEESSVPSTTQKVDKIYSLSRTEFKKLCQKIILSSLSHSIVQEYTELSNDDEVSYLTYNIKGSKKDLTLISFKRWKNIEVGELMIRDFLIHIQESGAKNGILVTPVDLSSSAKSYVSYNDKIKVYSKNQFNNFLKVQKF